MTRQPTDVDVVAVLTACAWRETCIGCVGKIRYHLPEKPVRVEVIEKAPTRDCARTMCFWYFGYDEWTEAAA